MFWKTPLTFFALAVDMKTPNIWHFSKVWSAQHLLLQVSKREKHFSGMSASLMVRDTICCIPCFSFDRLVYIVLCPTQLPTHSGTASCTFSSENIWHIISGQVSPRRGDIVTSMLLREVQLSGIFCDDTLRCLVCCNNNYAAYFVRHAWLHKQWLLPATTDAGIKLVKKPSILHLIGEQSHVCFTHQWHAGRS